MQIHARFEQIDVQNCTSYYQIYLRMILIECTSTLSEPDHSMGPFRATNMQIHARFEQIDVQSCTSCYQIYLREILIEFTSLLAMLRKQRRLGTVATTRYI